MTWARQKQLERLRDKRRKVQEQIYACQAEIISLNFLAGRQSRRKSRGR
jgi:hypothetical protein